MAFKRSHKKCEKPSETLLTFKGQWFEGTTDIENRATQPRRLSFVCITPNKFSFIQCKIPSTDDLNSSEFVDEILSLFGFQINATEQNFRVGLLILDYSGTKMIVNKDRHFFN